MIKRILCFFGLHYRMHPDDGRRSYPRKAVPYRCVWCGHEWVTDETNHEWYP